MLMGPALLLGAAEATAKLFSSDLKSSASWMSDFKTGTQIYFLYLLYLLYWYKSTNADANLSAWMQTRARRPTLTDADVF